MILASEGSIVNYDFRRKRHEIVFTVSEQNFESKVHRVKLDRSFQTHVKRQFKDRKRSNIFSRGRKVTVGVAWYHDIMKKSLSSCEIIATTGSAPKFSVLDFCQWCFLLRLKNQVALFSVCYSRMITRTKSAS